MKDFSVDRRLWWWFIVYYYNSTQNEADKLFWSCNFPETEVGFWAVHMSLVCDHKFWKVVLFLSDCKSLAINESIKTLKSTLSGDFWGHLHVYITLRESCMPTMVCLDQSTFYYNAGQTGNVVSLFAGIWWLVIALVKLCTQSNFSMSVGDEPAEVSYKVVGYCCFSWGGGGGGGWRLELMDFT